MPRYSVTVSEIRRVERTVVIEAESKKYARLAAEDPDNWQDPSDLREDVERSELTGVDVTDIQEIVDDADGDRGV